MEELNIYENEEFGQVRTVVIDDESWFVGKDVAVALGYENPSKAIRDHVDDEDKIMGVQNVTLSITDSMGRIQYPTWINESGVYSLIFSSKLESAKRFKHWVTSEVLPSIRKTGAYGEISKKWQNFMERQEKFNQMILDKLDNKIPNHNVNRRIINHQYTFDEIAVIEERKKELYRMTAKAAELCGVSHTGLLHQAYKAIEDKLGIVLDFYRSVYRTETGKENAGMVEVIAAHDWIYESAVDLCEYVIGKHSVFD